MTLITADRTAVYTRLANDIDAALGRSDELGMGLLRALLPELTESIEEINDGLRETDALLFEGLRDEAIRLHDEGFSAAAIRLHLDDKPKWANAKVAFDAEGIAAPPSIDFEAMSALNAAFADVDRMQKPIAKLRRMVLERASLSSKVTLLRKLRQHDGVKPVWVEQLKAHEEARLLEMADQVAAATAAHDVHALAACNQELREQEWTVPVPSRLKEEVARAEAWLGIRDLVIRLAEIVPLLAEDVGTTDGEIDDARRLRDEWVAGESRCQEYLALLFKTSGSGRRAELEGIARDIKSWSISVAPALMRLGVIDSHNDRVRCFHEACADLASLAGDLPPVGSDAMWLDDASRTRQRLESLVREVPGLNIPDELVGRMKVAFARVEMRTRRRAGARRLAIGAGILAAIVVASAGWALQNARIRRAKAVQQLKGVVALARDGAFTASPYVLDEAASRYPSDEAVGGLLEEAEIHIKKEADRGSSFRAALGRHATLVAEAQRGVDEREQDGTDALEAWPDSVFESKELLGQARRIGGKPSSRASGVESRQLRDDENAKSPEWLEAVQRWDEEEEKLRTCELDQKKIDSRYAKAASMEVEKRMRSIERMIPSDLSDDGAKESLQKLLNKLRELNDTASKPQSMRYASPKRVPYSILTALSGLEGKLKTLIQSLESP